LQIEKEKVVALVRQVAGPQRAEQADRLLPDPIDLDRYAGVLRELGVEPADLMTRTTTWLPEPLRGLLSRFIPQRH
jgi:hypothetical protein